MDPIQAKSVILALKHKTKNMSSCTNVLTFCNFLKNCIEYNKWSDPDPITVINSDTDELGIG